jgi:hypothetical protein
MALTKVDAADLITGVLPAANGGTGTTSFPEPGTTGNVLTSNGSAWTSSTPAAGGKVLQVVQTTKTNAFSTSSQQPTFADVTGLSVSITPSSASNKILVLCSFQMSSDNATVVASARLVRNSTAIFIGDASGSNARASAATGLSQTYSAAGSAIAFLDSPATTSSTTYKIQMAKGEGGGTVYMNRPGDGDTGTNRSMTPASIIVMEIAA